MAMWKTTAFICLVAAVPAHCLPSAQLQLNEGDYISALRATTHFYGAQRSGTLEDNWLLQLYPDQAAGGKAASGECFVDDGKSYKASVDFSGGWHDAGDNIKFTLTTAWSVYALIKAIDAFPAGHGDLHGASHGSDKDGVPDILNQAKWATDWLLAISEDPEAVVSQIGDYRDHNNGLTCPSMTRTNDPDQGGGPRTVWFGSSENETSGTKADILGITSAALALMSTVYVDYDAAYSTRCKNRADAVFKVAKQRLGTTSEPPNQSYYKDNTYKDGLACASIELARAFPGNTSYLDAAKDYNSQVGVHGWVPDWSNHIDMCRHSMAKFEMKDEVKDDWTAAIEDYISKVVPEIHDPKSASVGGLAFVTEWGSLRTASNMAFSAALYDQIYDSEPARLFAASQLDYILGENGHDQTFIVGWSPPSKPNKLHPSRPHHKNAFGRDQWPSTDSSPEYSLSGAVVGGPHAEEYSDGSLTSPAGYQDIMTDYICNEVTIDYNIGTVGTLSWALQDTVAATPDKVSDKSTSDGSSQDDNSTSQDNSSSTSQDDTSTSQDDTSTSQDDTSTSQTEGAVTQPPTTAGSTQNHSSAANHSSSARTILIGIVIGLIRWH